jgi:hypothetical protein
MGHDHHFLSRLDRVDHECEDLALRFYREPDLLRLVMGSVKIPDDCERVALSLRHHERGPFVIVSREGRFITCLAEGMYLGDRFVIRRELLDAAIEQAKLIDSRFHTFEKLSTKDECRQLLLRLGHGANTVSSEEIHAVLLFKYFFINDAARFILNCDEVMAESYRRHKILRRTPGKQAEDCLRMFWEATWGQAHVLGIHGLELPEGLKDPIIVNEGETDPRTNIAYLAVHNGLAPAAFRGAWVAGSVGTKILEQCFDGLRDATNLIELVGYLLALLGIGARHPEMADRVRHFLRKRCFEQTPDDSLEKLKEWLGGIVVECFKKPNDALKELDEKASCFVNAKPDFATLRRHYDNKVPIEIARILYSLEPVASASYANLPRTFMVANWAARQPNLESLYLPRDILRLVQRKWTKQESLDLLENLQTMYRQPKPLIAQECPGPNDTCNCGSNKKYKKCCGAFGGAKRAQESVAPTASSNGH